MKQRKSAWERSLTFVLWWPERILLSESILHVQTGSLSRHWSWSNLQDKDSEKNFIHYIAEAHRQGFIYGGISSAPIYSILMDGSVDAGKIEDKLIVILYCSKDVTWRDSVLHKVLLSWSAIQNWCCCAGEVSERPTETAWDRWCTKSSQCARSQR